MREYYAVGGRAKAVDAWANSQICLGLAIPLERNNGENWMQGTEALKSHVDVQVLYIKGAVCLYCLCE